MHNIIYNDVTLYLIICFSFSVPYIPIPVHLAMCFNCTVIIVISQYCQLLLSMLNKSFILVCNVYKVYYYYYYCNNMHALQLFLTCSQNTSSLSQIPRAVMSLLCENWHQFPNSHSCDVTALRIMMNVTLFAEPLCKQYRPINNASIHIHCLIDFNPRNTSQVLAIKHWDYI